MTLMLELLVWGLHLGHSGLKPILIPFIPHVHLCIVYQLRVTWLAPQQEELPVNFSLSSRVRFAIEVCYVLLLG